MISVVYGDSFLKSARRVPPKEQKKLARLLTVLQKNPFHSMLHTKSLSGELAGLYSFRITRDWRVIFKFLDPEIIFLIDLGHRKDIYQ
jgi:addiction module RelE/StbE family toxin